MAHTRFLLLEPTQLPEAQCLSRWHLQPISRLFPLQVFVGFCLLVGALVGADEGGVSVGRLDGDSDTVALGAALGLEDLVFDGDIDGDREGDWDSTGEGFELGFWLNVGSAEGVTDGAPLGFDEGNNDGALLGLVEGSMVGPKMSIKKRQCNEIDKNWIKICISQKIQNYICKKLQLTGRRADTGSQTGRI